MTQDLLSATLDILSRIAGSAGHQELDEAFAGLEKLPGSDARLEDISALRRLVGEIRSALGNAGVAEKALSLLIDTTHDLSNTLEPQQLLHTIVARARSLVGANLAWVTVLDSDTDVFRTMMAEGYLSPATAGMKSYHDYGAVGLIMKTRAFFDTQDYLNDTRFQHLPELDRIFRTESIVSLAGFPMLADNEVHGFLFVADRYARKLSGRELSVLGSFALHAGVAMRNANAFRLLSEALAEAQRNRAALIDHIQRVETSAAAHDEMTSLLAAGAEQHQFLQQMASQISAAIFLYDGDLRVREEFVSASYRGQAARAVKGGNIESALLIKAISQSRHNGRSAMVFDTGSEQCRAIALHGGTERGACLLVCHEGELDAIDIRNLERNAVALSIARLWNERRETEKLIASSTLLRHLVLVAPPDTATVSAIRDRLSLGTGESIVLALIVVTGLDRSAQTTAIRACAAGINLLVDLVDDFYLAVGPDGPMHAFLQRLEKSRGRARVGGILSDPFADVEAAPEHFARLNRAFQVLRRMTTIERFLAQSEVNLFAKIFEVGDASRLARYLGDLLAPIDANARHSGQLKQTLLSYFDNKYNLTRVADTLGVHINTVRQRLDTLRVATGGWDDPVKALELHVALRLDAIATLHDTASRSSTRGI